MRINHNIAALNTYRQLTTNMTSGSKSLEKLSSGLRINRAGDDAAGLAISEKMRAQIRGLNQAQRNAQDGISMIQTTEGALNESHSILQRMRELAAQAANDTNVDVDRQEIQKEINQLTSEINRIGNTTEFNTQSLLKGKNVAVVETAADTKTITDGVTGVAVGGFSALSTVKASVKAESSSASVQASTSKATGKASEITETTESIKGAKATVNLSVGISVQASEFGTDLNGKDVTVRQGTVAGDASRLEVDGQGNYIFTIGQTSGGSSRATNLGTLYNEMKSAIDNYDSATGFTSTNAISVVEPPQQNTAQPVTLDSTGVTQALEAGIAERNGVYEFDLTDKFEEAGDSITIGGQKFTAVLSGADASKGEFNIGNIEASLTGGEVLVKTDLSGIAATAEVNINIGGKDFTIANGDLNDNFATTAAMVAAVETAKAADGTLITDVAKIELGTDGKLVIKSLDPQTLPVTWTASSGTAADIKTVNDAFGMNTVAQLEGAATVLTDDFNGAIAKLESGTIGGIAAAHGTSATIQFGGVTITLTEATTGNPVAISGVTSNSATISYDFAHASSNSLSLILDKVVEAFGDVQDLGGLSDFTITKNGGSDGLVATAKTAGATTAEFTETGVTTIATAGSAAQQAAGVTGTDAVNANTNITLSVDGKDFVINSAALKTLDAGFTATNLQDLVKNAVDNNGYKLSDFADVTLDGGTDLIITSKGGQPTSNILFSINAGVAGDLARLQTAFGITNYKSDAGADAVSSSRSIADQAKSLAAAIEANSTLGGRFEYAEVTSGTIKLTETNNQATGATLNQISVAGSGGDDKLVITNAGGQNLNTVSITRALDTTATKASATVQSNGQTLKLESGTSGNQANRANSVKVDLKANSTDALNVTYKDGTLTINMASTTKANNEAADIQSAVRALGTIDGIDFSDWTATAGGTWDTTNDAADIEVASASFSGGQATVTENQLNVTVDKGNLTIHLSAEAASENTAAKIQAAVQDLGEYFYTNDKGEWTSIDFSDYTFKAEGNWDTKTLGNSIVKDSDTLVGGTVAVEGSYKFDVDTAFEVGDTVVIKGQSFKAVEGVASATKGEFSVSGGVLKDQAASLMTALNLNSAISGQFVASANSTTITLTEKVATGEDLKGTEVGVHGTGTKGEFSVNQKDLLTSGSKFIIDGEEITISDKVQHVGYGKGTAVKESETLADQTKALADAINLNDNLKSKYTASVGTDGSLVLTQTEAAASEVEPVVSTKNSSEGDFKATFQIGANSGQSMTITVEDMRAGALNLSGDGSVGTVAANNGAVATYTTVANVNSGSDNNSVEFALDVTSSEKASAALSVINDAIERVSAQRSQLGAFQNRLEHTINNLGTSSENLVAAESRIRDVDMAAEMMDFTKNNILSQAAQAMLAQANQLPQGVLQLLR